MSVLGREDIIDLLQRKQIGERLFVTPVLSKSQIGEASIDLRLGYDFLTVKRGNIGSIDPADISPQPDRFRNRHRLNRRERFYLHPNELALASTLEYFSFPASVAGYVTSRSKWGRLGLIIATAVAIHPGFKGTITLELVNHGNVPLVLYPGLLVAQIVFLSSTGATPYQGNLSLRTNVHPSNVQESWQKDWLFWRRTEGAANGKPSKARRPPSTQSNGPTSDREPPKLA